MIKIDDKQFELYLSNDIIQSRIKELAQSINSSYKDKELVFIVVLKGSFLFAADLIRHISVEHEIHFIRLSSYSGTVSTGKVLQIIGLDKSLTDCHLIILEDIVDTGLTLQKINSILQSEKPASMEVCTLLFKPEAYQGEIAPRYIGFSIPNKFVVGFGLDYNEKGRNKKDIYQLKTNT